MRTEMTILPTDTESGVITDVRLSGDRRSVTMRFDPPVPVRFGVGTMGVCLERSCITVGGKDYPGVIVEEEPKSDE